MSKLNKIGRNDHMYLQIRLQKSKFQKILFIGGDEGFLWVSSKCKFVKNQFFTLAPPISTFDPNFLTNQLDICWNVLFNFMKLFVNNITTGGHFNLFSQKHLRGHSNSPKGASDPKIPLKPLEDIHLKIQTLKYQSTKRYWRKCIFLKWWWIWPSCS